MVLFMDLVTNGDFTPLVKRPPYIGIRPASFPSVEEAKQQRVPLSKQIFNNYNLLKMPMQRHETLFISAWKKNSVNLRTNVFEKEWSEMNRNHNMAFKDMLNWRAPTEQSCKWPPIIVEDFSYKDSFLVFLKSRASVGPSAFYWLDKESWQIGVGANIIKVPYLSD
ncbi:uncharacterized protein N7473_009646 [Penicillium subrubescens]|uniref:Uncharacterized protein n=1 Tax=Penicillium subrubescens TaxID=1316194 RepID=A0A1Q5THA8_9EURO|nr:uncharacterized protein N7473_009646 [Penicillium subrubescens]KAJ5886972.1 hypothetical protein N7473_009646 [Penicillium subrubescens]OKO99610.1 hypothetical protein PENSUB_8263 [Penicillium subrubescens]